MAPPRMRPRFEFQLPVGRAAWFAALRALLSRDPGICDGQVFQKHAFLEVKPGSRHVWSPYLNLEVREESAGISVAGRFSPHPHMWTLFMAIYLLLAIGALAGLVYGVVQYVLGQTPWALAALPVGVALIGFVYGATLIGQGLGAEQMYVMRSLVDRASQEATAGEAESPELPSNQGRE